MSKKLNDNTPVREADEAILTALIKKGAHEYLENDLESAEDSTLHGCTLSETCEHNIKKIIRGSIRKEKRHRGLRKISKFACVFLVILVIFSIAAMSVEAVRVKVLNLVISTSDIVTEITVEDSLNPARLGGNIEGAPTYLPPGYQFSAMDKLEKKCTLVYMDNEDNEIRVKIFDIGYKIGIDTENAECGDISINGNEGFYSVKNGYAMLLFKTDVHAYLIIGQVSVSELIKMAESIK